MACALPVAEETAKPSPGPAGERPESRALPALPRPRNPRYRCLDLWRGLACLLVVLFHAPLYATYKDSEWSRRESPIGSAMKSVRSQTI